ncbi:C40 family peptidase [Desulfovibrio sp. OttesenSCG-928-I05]|nr:C40 family peptidase [Desulfovibrio sp. OttesenSCG-928-I05]
MRALSSPSVVVISRRSVLRLGALFALALFPGCGKRSIPAAPTGKKRQPEAVLATVRSQIGVRYTMGGTSPRTGFDCSGLLFWSFAQHGVKVPRTAKEQAACGKSVRRGDLRPGDIVVFRISAKQGLHTGLASGNGRFIHSPSSGGKVREESIGSSYWSPRFVNGRRVL